MPEIATGALGYRQRRVRVAGVHVLLDDGEQVGVESPESSE
jgi:hypothetical protein